MIRILCERPTSLIRFIEFLLCHGTRITSLKAVVHRLPNLRAEIYETLTYLPTFTIE